MSDYYVYLHRKATNGEVFYVGKGKDDRAYIRHNRSVHWNNAVSKHGFIVEFVEIGIQEWYAFELERDTISLYGRSDMKQGALVNFTDGGEGTSGRVFSEETRKKIGNASKNRIVSEESRSARSSRMTGTKLPEETRQKIAAQNVKRNQSTEQRMKISASQKGKRVTDETKQKLRDAWSRRKERIKKDPTPQSTSV